MTRFNAQSTRCSIRRAPSRLGHLGGVGLLLFSALASAQDEGADDTETPEQEVVPPAELPPAGPAPALLAPDASGAEEPPATEGLAPPDDEAVFPTLDATAVGASSGALEEVVVTADRRRKSLQDYAGTAQAFSQQKMQQIGITSVSGLSSLVPGLQIGQQEGNTEVYVRGVGNDNNAEHGDMGVAVHLDGVYLPRPRGVGALFFDIERVEVASGPQGTLRGRNAMGGSMDIVTAKPQLGEYAANAQATFGTFSERRYEGMVNIPLGETLAVRFAGLSNRHDPHWQNGGPLNDLRAPQDEDMYAMRLQVKWQPTAAFSAIAGADFTQEAGTGYTGANFDGALRRVNNAETPNNPGDDYYDPLAPDDIDNPRVIYQLGHQARQLMKHRGARLSFNYDLGPMAIEGLGSYRDLVYTQVTGGSAGVIYPGFDFANQGTDFFGSSYWLTRSQSQVFELRAFAPDTSRVRWTAGIFGLLEQQQILLQQVSDPVNGYGGAEFNMPDVDGDSFAAYADATFDVTPRFRLLGGLRATTETKSRLGGLALQQGGVGTLGRYGTEGFKPRYLDRTLYTEEQALADLSSTDLPPALRDLPDGDPAKESARAVAARVNLFLDGVGSFGARDEVARNLCQPVFQAEPLQTQDRTLTVRPDGALRCTNGINETLARTANGFGLSATSQNAETSNHFLDWRAGAEFDVTSDSLLYTTLSTAHKAAGYNDNINTPVPFDLYYGPESVLAYELGSKNTFLERKLRLNASLFFYRYSDQVFQQIVQIGEPDANGQANTTALRQNAATSSIYGVDMDFLYALPLGLEVELHALVMDARYGERTLVQDGRLGYNVGNYEVDLDGKWLPRASKYTLNYGLSQVVYSGAGRFNWTLQGQTRSQHFMSAFNGQGNVLPEATGRVPATDAGQSELADALARPERLTDVVPMYSVFNAGVGWQHPDGRIAINGYVNNLTNIAYATSIISTPNLNLRFFNPPRTAGVRIRVDW